ncbi:MAG: hypothetical protein ACT4OK_12430 [Gemmobacter sp.]
MLSQITGALVRAVLVMVLVATPSVLVPGTGMDGKQMVALVALFAGILTFVEYFSTYPGLIEFRDAAPYNRTRYVMLFLMVFLLSVAARNDVAPSTTGALVAALAHVMGAALDFPYSPVRLVTLMLTEGRDPAMAQDVRAAAGAAYMVALLVLCVFVLVLRLRQWPGQDRAFNVWVNLPTFDPTAGGDVVARLERDARANLAMGFVLPFVIPAVMQLGGMGLGTFDLAAPQTLIWTISAWAFLPASLFMRGIAMGRIASRIRDRRRQVAEGMAGEFSPV